MCYLYKKNAIYGNGAYANVVQYSDYVEVDSTNNGIKFKKACKYIQATQSYGTATSQTVTEIKDAVVGTSIANAQAANYVRCIAIIE